MKTVNWRALVGVLLVVFGGITMLQTMNVITFAGDIWLWIFAAVFALAGLGFIWVLVSAPVENWWAAIPGLTLLGLGALMMLVNTPGVDQTLAPAIFLGSIGLSFVIVFLLDRSRWWAVIPAGTLASVALMVALPPMGGWTASILFFGMAVTFGIIALLGKEKFHWAWYPAGALLVMGVFVPSVEGNMPWVIWPIALIVVGVYLVGRSFLKK